MKTLIFVLMVAAGIVAVGQDVVPAVSTDQSKVEKQAKLLGVTVEEYNKMAPEERKSKRLEKIVQRDEKQAKFLGMTVDDLKKLTPTERKQKLAAQKAERIAKQANDLGVTVEDYNKMSPEERKAKIKEIRKSKKAAKKSTAK